MLRKHNKIFEHFNKKHPRYIFEMLVVLFSHSLSNVLRKEHCIGKKAFEIGSVLLDFL